MSDPYIVFSILQNLYVDRRSEMNVFTTSGIDQFFKNYSISILNSIQLGFIHDLYLSFPFMDRNQILVLIKKNNCLLQSKLSQIMSKPQCPIHHENFSNNSSPVFPEMQANLRPFSIVSQEEGNLFIFENESSENTSKNQNLVLSVANPRFIFSENNLIENSQAFGNRLKIEKVTTEESESPIKRTCLSRSNDVNFTTEFCKMNLKFKTNQTPNSNEFFGRKESPKNFNKKKICKLERRESSMFDDSEQEEKEEDSFRILKKI